MQYKGTSLCKLEIRWMPFSARGRVGTNGSDGGRWGRVEGEGGGRPENHRVIIY